MRLARFAAGNGRCALLFRCNFCRACGAGSIAELSALELRIPSYRKGMVRGYRDHLGAGDRGDVKIHACAVMAEDLIKDLMNLIRTIVALWHSDATPYAIETYIERGRPITVGERILAGQRELNAVHGHSNDAVEGVRKGEREVCRCIKLDDP